MRPEIGKFLHDIRDAAECITDYTRGKTWDDYLADRKMRDAVQWIFAVIGEASANWRNLILTSPIGLPNGIASSPSAIN